MEFKMLSKRDASVKTVVEAWRAGDHSYSTLLLWQLSGRDAAMAVSRIIMYEPDGTRLGDFLATKARPKLK